MKASVAFLFSVITFPASFFLVTSQTDSCTNKLSLNVLIPFDTTNLYCLTVWNAESFILRYAQTSSNIWSFILSTPDTNSYIAIGFSANGSMVGSSAIVGWISGRGSSGGVKQYYLGGQTSAEVVPDKGNLYLVGNSTFITLQSSRLFMVFQLQLQTNQPESWLIYATGPTGIFPSPPGYELIKHLDKTSTRMDYLTDGEEAFAAFLIFIITFNTSVNVGNPPSSASAPSQSQAVDSCNSRPNLNVPLTFDTTNLSCVDVWSTQGFILRYSQPSAYIWSFILSTPNPNSYIAMGFSPNGGMVGSSAIVGWFSSNGGGAGMKQYYLGGKTANQVMPDRGNLQILNNSAKLTSQSSRLYMAFQLQINQPLPRLIFAVGPVGIFPSAPSFALMQHQAKLSTSLNYATGREMKTSGRYVALSGLIIVILTLVH